MFETMMPIISDFLNNYGYISLFITAFLAASVIPLGPEPLIIAMFKTHNLYMILLVATVGSYFGSVTTYFFGYFGVQKLFKRWEIISQESFDKALKRFKKYGAWTLLISSVPIIGDAFVFVAGALKYDFKPFSILVFIGKFIRFTLVLFLLYLGYNISTLIFL
ncbi:MAG: DedA family protein [Methanimicrococcus sp.]|nr:DedA family protein [Methanimicrococcus sp.]